MFRTLRFGSTGDQVVKLQTGLNLLFSQLAKLKTDGIYGARTTARVREFQGSNGLVSDGVTGPLTWGLFAQLLAQVQQGGIPVLETLPPPAVDVLRPIVLTIAQQHFGVVDFQQQAGGKPKGLDFLIKMFQFAANTTLTEENFRDNKKKVWIWEPWIGAPSQKKSWCGIFCVYCYRKAGINVYWNLGNGKPYGNINLNGWSPQFAAGIRPADIGCVASKSHHFLIESVDGKGPEPVMTTIDGNRHFGRIERVWSNTIDAHRVNKDQFNYYSIT